LQEPHAYRTALLWNFVFCSQDVTATVVVWRWKEQES